MQDVRIVKSKLYSDYTIIPNEILRRADISAKAKGLFCYLISLPSDWKIYKKEVQRNFKDGYDSINSAFKELEDTGYLVSKDLDRTAGMFTGKLYILYMYPYGLMPEMTDRENPHQPIGKIHTGTDMENPQLLSTNILLSKKTKVNLLNEEQIEEIYNSYPTKCTISKRSTQKSKVKNKEQINKLNIKYEILIKIIKGYIDNCTKSKTYLKNFSTFLNNIPDLEEEKELKEEKEINVIRYNLKVS